MFIPSLILTTATIALNPNISAPRLVVSPPVLSEETLTIQSSVFDPGGLHSFINSQTNSSLSSELTSELLSSDLPSSEVLSELPSSESSPEPPSTPTEQSAETEDEIFERVFGQPRPQSQAITVPFFIDDQRQGQVVVMVAGSRASRVQAAPILEETADILQPDLQNQIETAVDDAGYITLDAFEQVGIAAIFDQRQLELYLQIPPALRKTNVIDSSGLPPEAADALPTSHISGYINLRGGEDVVWSGAERGRQPLRLNMDGALNIENWVLEGSASWMENAAPALTRGDVRIVRDDPDHALRYIVGDLSIPLFGAYQTSVPMGGISVSRNFDLQPYRVTRPTGETTFFLERPSTVDVLINGVQVQELRLEAGTQDIRNLSLSTGTNDVQLIITDDLGQVQRLDFSAVIAGNLLAPGLQQFSYNLGFPSEAVNGDRHYNWQEPTLSLSHRWGSTNTLTLGSYLQANPHFQLLGANGVWASSFGNVGWDVAASHTPTLGADVALQVQYEHSRSGAENPTNRSFRVAVEYRGANFTTMNALSPSDYSFNVSAYYGQILFGDINASLSGNYRVGRGISDTYTTYLGLSRSFGNGISGNLNLSYGRNQQGNHDARAFLGLYWLFPQQRQSLSVNTQLSNTDEANTQLSWSVSPDRTVQGAGASIDLSHGSDRYDLSGRIAYTNYRFDLSVTQDLVFPEQALPISNTTRLTFGTALVFADGHFGWSRPITNSFVLVVPRRHWRGQRIGVNPTNNGYFALVDFFGPAVLPDLQPYYVSTVRLSAPDAPLGYDLGENRYTVMPSYRSGTLILAGTEASVFIRGVLVDAAGTPIELQAGDVVSLSDPDWQPQALFTNRVGRFALSGFTAGRYEVRFRNQQPIQFEIPSEQEGVYDLGTLQFSAQ